MILADGNDADSRETENQRKAEANSSNVVQPEIVSEPPKNSTEPLVPTITRQSIDELATEPVSTQMDSVQFSRWPGDQDSVIAAEPKDDSWAHHTELAILDFLSNRPNSTHFDILYVECRTTFCQIRVSGFDESTRPEWQQIVYDLRQQSWFDFNQQGNSSGWINGQFIIVQNLEKRVVGDQSGQP